MWLDASTSRLCLIAREWVVVFASSIGSVALLDQTAATGLGSPFPAAGALVRAEAMGSSPGGVEKPLDLSCARHIRP